MNTPSFIDVKLFPQYICKRFVTRELKYHLPQSMSIKLKKFPDNLVITLCKFTTINRL